MPQKNRLAGAVLVARLAVVACLGSALLPMGPAHAQARAKVAAPASPAIGRGWVPRSAVYEVNVRDFSPTGDFPGVTAGLDKIAGSGANVLWLMPIYPVGIENHKGTLGSPYSVRDYRGINAAFGTEADFRALLKAVHARGMKLILDWVPNHTAWDNPWVKEHPDWYRHDAQGKISVPVDPQGKPTDWTDVAGLDYSNPALRKAMIADMGWWIDRYGIDGYRVDAAGFVPDAFWEEAVPALRRGRKPILLLAEWGDLKMHRFGFDLTYPWDSYSRLKAVWNKGEPASSFVARELEDLKGMPAGGERLRFTTNHDETGWDNPPVTLFGGRAGARAAYVAMALLPGRPLLYDGQEVESPQKLALFEREAIAWGQPDSAAARAFYRRVIALTRNDADFVTGDFRAVETDAPADVIAYTRGKALVLVNARNHPVRATVSGVRVAGMRDLLTGRTQGGGAVELPAYGALVLRRGGPPR